MLKRHLIIVSLATLLFSGCNQTGKVGQKGVVVQNTQLIGVDEYPTPPRSVFTTAPTSFESWFFTFCQNPPAKGILLHYKLHLSETKDRYLVFCKEQSQPRSVTDTVYYYAVSKNEYANMNLIQAQEKMKTQLLAFANDNRFKNAALSKAVSVQIELGKEALKLK